MCRCANVMLLRGKTRKDHISNQFIQEDANVCQNVNIPESQNISMVSARQGREEDNLSIKKFTQRYTWEEKMGTAYTAMARQHHMEEK